MPKARILYVEDDGATRHAITSVLEKMFGYEVIQAVDDREGYEKFEQEAVHGKGLSMILADIHLRTHQGGLEFLDKIRENYPDSEKIPVLLLTAYAEELDLNRLTKDGSVKEVLEKPINNHFLGSRIEHYLTKQEKSEDNDRNEPYLATKTHI